MPKVSDAMNRTYALIFLITIFHRVFRFLFAYQHLEQIGKIQLARFSNTQDIVPLIPFVDKFKIGRPYMHVGMHVRLHGTSNWAQYWLRNALDVTYPKHQDIISHIKRGFLNNVFTNLNTLKGKKCTCLL